METNKLREYRGKKRKSLSQVSRRTKIHKSYLSKIENGLRTPRYDKMRTLAKYFGCSVDELFGGK
jgi:transcriptional regulator with XRE-family HTH domain